MVDRHPALRDQLSAAQIRVLELLLVGMTEPEIAARLSRSRHTVHDHTKAIYATLNVSYRVQLILLFSGWPSPEPMVDVEPKKP